MGKINHLGIVGSGQMGRGIAQVFAQSGIKTSVYDTSSEQLLGAKEFIQKQLEKGAEKGKWASSGVSLAMGGLTFSSEIQSLSTCDFVIEAATENLVIKKEILKKLDVICSSECIFASNTSSISITDLASITKRPEKVVGMHFMNPVPVMKLVEGIKGLLTSDDTFEQTKNLVNLIGKQFIASKDYPGFIVNRILMPMINEAIYAIFEGVSTAEEIDMAMKLGTNVPMGPLELADFIGLDTCLSIMEVLYKGMSDSKYRPCPLLKNYVMAGRLGRKTSMGFYKY